MWGFFLTDLPKNANLLKEALTVGSVVDRAPVETDWSEWHAEIHGSGEVREAVAVGSGHVEVDGLLRPPVSPRSELAALGSVERQPVDVVGRGPAKTSRCDQ